MIIYTKKYLISACINTSGEQLVKIKLCNKQGLLNTDKNLLHTISVKQPGKYLNYKEMGKLGKKIYTTIKQEQ